MQHFIDQTAQDKLDLLVDNNDTLTSHIVKQKLDAVAWHARMVHQLNATQIQDALTLFKRNLMPSDNLSLRNEYIKFMDHRSNAISCVAA